MQFFLKTLELQSRMNNFVFFFIKYRMIMTCALFAEGYTLHQKVF